MALERGQNFLFLLSLLIATECKLILSLLFFQIQIEIISIPLVLKSINKKEIQSFRVE